MKFNKDIIDESLSDHERLALQMIADNPVQLEAVRKVLMFGVYNNGTLKKGVPTNPLMNFAMGIVTQAENQGTSDEALGAKLRAAWEGIQWVETAFNFISLYKKENQPKPKQENPAR